MTIPDLSQLLESKFLLSGGSVVVGAFLGNLIAVLRARIRTLEYCVNHDHVAFSANDAIFGSIQVTWQNHNVTNLFSSRVELENRTGKDLTDLKIKVFTTDTLMLGERTEITGTTHVLKFTPEFAQQLAVPAGATPTQQQFTLYNHNREYLVPVLNRGQRVVMTYLTTVPIAGQGPAVWLDMLHPGIRVQYRAVVPQIHGVPTRTAIAIGLLACVAVLVVSSIMLSEPWAAALVCLLVGLFAQSVGAFIYRGFGMVKSLVVR